MGISLIQPSLQRYGVLKMNFIESLTIYTSSQKVVAAGFIAVGLVLILLAGTLMMQSILSTQLWQGFKIGALSCGLLILAGGIGYLKFCDKTQVDLLAMYEKDQAVLVQAEKERMQKVVREYSVYQAVFAAIIVLCLLTILIGREFLMGVSFSVALLFLCVMLMEAHSKSSIIKHNNYIQSLSIEG